MTGSQMTGSHLARGGLAALLARAGRPGARQRAAGFTLVELMITLVIASVVMALAVPSFDAARVSAQVSSYANALVASAQLARSEAIKRNTTLQMCVSSNGTSCDATSAAGGWENGWIILDGTTVVFRQQAADAGYKISGVDSVTGSVKSRAFPSTGIGTAQTTFTVCRANPVGSQERVVTLYPSGRSATAKTRTGTCS